MGVLSPPEPPRTDDLELLIREAQARQRQRRIAGAFAVAVLAGTALAAYSLATGVRPRAPGAGVRGPAAGSGKACGVRVDDMRIVDRAGNTIYREPGHWTPSYPHPSVVRCSGSSVWVVWDNGAAMSQEGYVGAHSGDGGRTWRLVFAESYFGVDAPHELDSYLGPWMLSGRAAYFVGLCPACGAQPTVSLWVTRNAGGTFRRYEVPGLGGYWPIGIRVVGHRVTISAKRFRTGEPPRKTATIHVA